MAQISNEDVFLQIETYIKNSEHYYENSKELLSKNELAKAGELLWGAVAQAAKALSLSYGNPLPTHNAIRNFFTSLALDYKKQKPELYELTKSTQLLHVNFYETFLNEEEFKKDYTDGEILLRFLHQKIKK